jgi:hypothetical protein
MSIVPPPSTDFPGATEQIAAGQSKSRAPREILRGAMRPYAGTYACCFRDLVRSHADLKGENSLFGSVQLILTDPPYTTRSMQGLSNSDHDVLSPMDIKEASELISKLLRPGGHAIVFCAIEQLSDWQEALGAALDMAVDRLPLFAVRAPGAYSQQPFRLTTTLHNMVEVAVHATKLGSGRQGFKMVSYSNFGCVPSRFPGWCNVIDNIRNYLLQSRSRTLKRAGRSRFDRNKNLFLS